MGATFHKPGEGETLPMGASSVVIKAGGEDTGGTLFLSEATFEPGGAGPPPHVHDELHDMFYVLEGELTLHLGDEAVAAPAGSFACVPPGTVHTFSNESDAPVRFLNFSTPAGFEEYMRELAAASAGGLPEPAEIGKIAARYDVSVV